MGKLFTSRVAFRTHAAKFFAVALILFLTLAAVIQPASASPVALQRETVFNGADVNHAVAFGDLDNDGDDDVVVGRQTVDADDGVPAQFTLQWYRNPGPGSSTWSLGGSISWTNPTPPAGPGFTGNDAITDIEVADINGGTHLDIVVSTLIGGTFWFTGNGGNPASRTIIYAGTGGSFPNSRQVAVGDVDGDGDNDVVTACGTGDIEGASTTPPPPGDAGFGAEIVLSLNNGSGGFAAPIRDVRWRAPVIDNIDSVHLADLVNGAGAADDNKLEIVVVSPESAQKVVWFYHDGTSWTTARPVGAAAQHTLPTDAHVGDFDGDGDLDICTVDASTDRVKWFANNATTGTGNFQAANTSPTTRPGGAPLYVVGADFDADGDDDILATFSGTDELVFYDNNGAGSFTERVYDGSTAPGAIQDSPADLKVSVATRVTGTPAEDDWLDVVIASNGGDEISFYDNTNFNLGPTISNVVVTNGDDGTSAFNVMFSEAMTSAGLNDPANWTISGAGLGTAGGTLTITGSGTTFSFSYSTGSFVDGADIIAAVKVWDPVTGTGWRNVQDATGVHIASPSSGTATNRLTNTVSSNTGIAGVVRAYTTDASLSITAVPGGGPAQGGQTFHWERNGTPVVNGGGITDATTATITIDSSFLTLGNDNDVWTCFLSDSRAEEVDADVTLNTAVALDLSPDPVNLIRFANQDLDIDGAPGPWMINSSGGFGPINYQWEYSTNGVSAYTPLSDAGPYSGTATNDLAISPLTPSELGFYHVVAVDDFLLNTGGAGNTSGTNGTHTSNAGGIIFDQNVLVDLLPGTGTGIDGLVSSDTGTATSYAGSDIVLEADDPIGGQFGGPYTYEWQLNNVDLGLPGTQQVTYTLVSGMSGDITVEATEDGSGNVGESGTLTITVVNPTAAAAAPLTQTAFETDTVMITVTPSAGIGPYSGYSWEFDSAGTAPGTWTAVADGPLGSGGAISGASTDTLTITIGSNAEEGLYRASLIDSGCGSGCPGGQATSNGAELIVDTPIFAVARPLTGTGIDGLVASATDTATVYEGSDISLGVDASGGENGILFHYQWLLDGVAPPGPAVADADTVTITMTAASGGNYFARVTEDGTAVPATDSSPVVAITVVPALSLSGPVAAQSVNIGNVATFAVVASDGIPSYSYQWEFDADPPGGGYVTLSDGPNVAGAASDTLMVTVTGAGDAGRYRCVVVDSGCGIGCPEGNETSTDSALTVTNDINPIGPASVNAYTGEALQLDLTVAGGTPPYTVDWFKRPDTGTSIQSDSGTGPFTLDLALADPSDIGDYYVEVDDSGPDLLATSPDATVDVRDLPTVTDPADVSVYDGSVASFSVTASGGYPPYSYDWRQDTVSLGAPDQDSYSETASLADDGTLIDVIVSDAGGTTGIKTVTSNTAAYSVVAPLSVTAPTPAPIARYTNEGAFTLTTTVAGGFPGPSYQWFINIPGTGDVDLETAGGVNNGLTLDFTPTPGQTLKGTVRVEANDGVGSAQSPGISFQVADPLTFNGPLEDITVAVGERAEFDVLPLIDGGIDPLVFQWLDDSKAALLGETDPQLVFDPAEVADSGNYAIQVMDSHPSSPSSIQSNFAALLVSAGLPLAGGLGLGALIVASALGGAAALRRRKH